MAQQIATSEVQRLVLCFDGTWNTHANRTNVARIHDAVAGADRGSSTQLKFYDEGVGTVAGSRIRGGVLGRGLDENILQGYCWLINNYLNGHPPRQEHGELFSAGPDIFIFGFSRGAYTARSLAGLINRCGILKREHFAREREGKAHTKASLVRRAWELYRRNFPAATEARYAADCVEFRDVFAWNAKVKFIGVWDTVGALGVPMFSRTLLARMKYGFHDTALGRVVENAYHACAIDEQRADYKVTLWTSRRENQNVEQRWFPGAHANVGGGYENDFLPAAPLKWIADRAAECGLQFSNRRELELKGDEHLSRVRDSYAEFMFGCYRLLRALVLKGRYERPLLTDGVAETIDETARMKWDADPEYRPRNLADKLAMWQENAKPRRLA